MHRALRISLGFAAIPMAPVVLHAMWSPMPTGWWWPWSFYMPFVAVAALGGIVWRFTDWRGVGIGLIVGVLTYALYLVVTFPAMEESS